MMLYFELHTGRLLYEYCDCRISVCTEDEEDEEDKGNEEEEEAGEEEEGEDWVEEA